MKCLHRPPLDDFLLLAATCIPPGSRPLPLPSHCAPGSAPFFPVDHSQLPSLQYCVLVKGLRCQQQKPHLAILGRSRMYQGLSELTESQRSNPRKQAGAKEHWREGTKGPQQQRSRHRKSQVHHPPALEDTLQPSILLGTWHKSS